MAKRHKFGEVGGGVFAWLHISLNMHMLMSQD